MKFFVVAIFALLALASVVSANDLNNTRNRHPSRLNAALCAGLSEVIWNGEYEAIFDYYIGAGNYIVPNPKDCKKAAWPGADTGDQGDNEFHAQYIPLKDVLASGILSFAGFHNPPFSVRAENSRKIVDGAEYQLARAIARRISIHYNVPITATFYDVSESYLTAFYDVVNALLNGASVSGAVVNYDVALGSLPLTKGIQYVLTPTCPYFYSYLNAIRTPLDPLVLVTTVWDFQQEGVKVGVIAGSTAAAWALNALPEDNIVFYNDQSLASLGINKGGIHVFVGDNWLIEGLAADCLDCQNLDIYLSSEQYVMGTKFVASGANVVASLFVLFFAFVAVVMF